MPDIFTIRFAILSFSTIFSVAVVMLMVGIITTQDVVAIFDLGPDGAQALENVVESTRVIWDNFLRIMSQLLNKLFDFAGVDIDLTKIEIDLDNPESNAPADAETPEAN